jgi:hypothetical protein
VEVVVVVAGCNLGGRTCTPYLGGFSVSGAAGFLKGNIFLDDKILEIGDFVVAGVGAVILVVEVEEGVGVVMVVAVVERIGFFNVSFTTMVEPTTTDPPMVSEEGEEIR